MRCKIYSVKVDKLCEKYSNFYYRNHNINSQ